MRQGELSLVTSRKSAGLRPVLLVSLVMCAFLWATTASDLGETTDFILASVGGWMDALIFPTAETDTARALQGLSLVLAGLGFALLAIGLIRGRGDVHKLQGWAAAALFATALPVMVWIGSA